MCASDEQQAEHDFRDQIARFDRLLDERAHRLRTSKGVPVFSPIGMVALIGTGFGLFCAGALFMTLIG